MTDMPFMPIPTDSFVADTNHMSAEQFGAYVRICFALWRHNGELADDDEQLARIAGIPIARWSKVAPIVLAGMVRRNGRIFSEAVLERLRVARARSQKGREAANVRWDKSKSLKSLDSSHANAWAEHLPRGMRPHSNHNHNYNKNRLSLGQATSSEKWTPALAPGAEPSLISIQRIQEANSNAETPAELEARRDLFEHGLPVLKAISGEADRYCRSELKKLLNLAGDDCPLLLELCQRAEVEQPTDVFTWLSELIAARASNSDGGGGAAKIAHQPQ